MKPSEELELILTKIEDGPFDLLNGEMQRRVRVATKHLDSVREELEAAGL
jgi:hypothetical protein